MVADLREHERGVGSGWRTTPAPWCGRWCARSSPHARDGTPRSAPSTASPTPCVGCSTGSPGEPLALVGHGIAWTLLIAEFTDCQPDPDALGVVGMPDLVGCIRPAERRSRRRAAVRA